MRVLDLRSDTVTKPTPAMRQAMAQAEVGDDVFKEDPTVNAFQKYAADLFGKEAALYFPTATMGNLASVMAHCDTRGEEVLLGDLSHIHINEQGGMAQLAGVHHRAIHTNPDGTLGIEEIVEKIRSSNIHYPKTSLICLENSHNICGGTVLPLSYMEQLGHAARSHGLKVHMDGARIFNAAIHLGVPVSTILKDCDSVSVCLSKGLGAPLGTIVAGDRIFIDRALRCRKALGGAMRQSGVVAAAGHFAMTNMVERLADDHRHTLELAKAINNLENKVLSVNMATVQTNILRIQANPNYWTAAEFCKRLNTVSEREEQVLGESFTVNINPVTDDFVRIVFHADINSDDAVLVRKKIIYVAQEKAGDF